MKKDVFMHQYGQFFLSARQHAPGDAIPADPTHLSAGTVIENVGMGVSTVHPSMDFETYSEVGYVLINGKIKGVGPGSKGGLPVVGTPVYAEHPSTEVICLYYDLKDGKGRRGWMPGAPYPQDLIDHIANGGMIEAFNSTFEWYIWNMICTKRYGWPFLQLEQTVCVMSRSRRHSLPGSLAKCAEALGTPDKDKAGKSLITKLTRPHTPTKNRKAIRRTPITDGEDFVAMYGYCDRDVETEDHAAARIPDLTFDERETWLCDQRINARGVNVDMESLDACLFTLEEATKLFTSELSTITGGAVNSVNEVAKMKEFLISQKCYAPDVTADTVRDLLARDDVAPLARRVLEIRAALGGANVKKLLKLSLQTSSDGRLRNQYMYCGADRTGRWSSAAADDNASNSQLQNITAKGPASQECADCGHIAGHKCKVEVLGVVGACPECGSNNWKQFKKPDGTFTAKRPDWTVEAVECALAAIRTRDLRYVMEAWGDPCAVLAGCLRGLFKAAPGKKLICADFSAVEAVVLACLSRCQWRIDVFNTHGKIYEMSASKIAGIPFEEFAAYKEANGMHHPLRKKIGKVAELASGYGGWIGAWCNFGAEAFMSEDEMKQNILKWRAESPEIVEFWGGQFRQTGQRMSEGHPELFGLEGMAVAAILSPGKCFSYIDITFAVKDDILLCRLPSGRFLHYHQPRLAVMPGKWGKPDSYSITFMGYNSNSEKGPIGWLRMETYGGRLAENVTQAVSADIQADALKGCERANYAIVMHTHDEGCAEVDEHFGSVDEMCAIMSKRPVWASWWPLRAAGWTHQRYQKD